MKKGAILRVSIVLLVCVSLGSFFVPSTAAQTGFKLTSIVRRHDSSPDGNPFFGCDTCVGEIAGPRAFNDRGDLVIRTALEGYCDLAGFLISGTEKIPLTVGCQQTAWGELQFDEAAINEQSQVVFTVYSYVDNQFNKMVLFSYQNGALTPLAGDGDPTPISTIFSRTSLVGPAINDKGDIIFEGFSIDDHGRERADIFMYSDDERRSIVGSGNPSPKGGQFSFVRLTSSPQVNASGEVLFYSSVVEGPAHQTDGLFQITRDEIKKVVVTGDNLPAGRRVDAPLGSLNDKGEVAFISNANDLFTQQDAGIYLYSGGLIQKVMTVGEAIPGGGHFGSFLKTGYVYPGPRINNNSAIAFKAYVKDRDSHVAIFLASPRAIIKVVAVGDALPTGETIKSIDTFALNNLGNRGQHRNLPAIGLIFFAVGMNQIALLKLNRDEDVSRRHHREEQMADRHTRIYHRLLGQGMVLSTRTGVTNTIATLCAGSAGLTRRATGCRLNCVRRHDTRDNRQRYCYSPPYSLHNVSSRDASGDRHN